MLKVHQEELVLKVLQVQVLKEPLVLKVLKVQVEMLVPKVPLVEHREL